MAAKLIVKKICAMVRHEDGIDPALFQIAKYQLNQLTAFGGDIAISMAGLTKEEIADAHRRAQLPDDEVAQFERNMEQLEKTFRYASKEQRQRIMAMLFSEMVFALPYAVDYEQVFDQLVASFGGVSREVKNPFREVENFTEIPEKRQKERLVDSFEVYFGQLIEGGAREITVENLQDTLETIPCRMRYSLVKTLTDNLP